LHVLVGVLVGVAVFLVYWPVIRDRMWGHVGYWRPRRWHAPVRDRPQTGLGALWNVAEAERLCREAGRPYGLTGPGLLALQWSLAAATGVLAWVAMGPPLGLAAAGLGWFCARLVVSAARDARHAQIMAELPVVLDLWSLLVAGGDGVESALVEISRRHPQWLLSQEIRRVLERVAASGLLGESLVAVARETGSPQFVAVAEQVRQFMDGGGAPARELARLAAAMRDERMSRMRQAAGTAAVVALVPKLGAVGLSLAPVIANILIMVARHF